MPAPFGDASPVRAFTDCRLISPSRVSVTYFANEFGGYRSRGGPKRALVRLLRHPYDKPTFALRLFRAAVEFSFEKYDVETGGARDASLVDA